MVLLPIFLTFISFLIGITTGKFIGIKGTCFITVTNIVTSFFISLYLFYFFAVGGIIIELNLANWISLNLVDLNYYFVFDSLTFSMFVVVTLVSSCAHIYSVEYMNGDPHQSRFMSYLSLFTFFMLILVSASNLIQLFVGWEGVGICSYLLINFWYTRIKANKSAIMAVVTNKVGDIALLISFGLFYYLFKSFDIYNIFILSILHDSNIIVLDQVTLSIIGILLVLGAVGKSAQIGLHIWLPEAMEGPTPVSSLIHAATMVTAGIFLIIRCSFLMELIPLSMLWIIFFGGLTTLFASSVGLFQNDLKKVVAYSTCSQLGYMFMACGLMGYNYSFFHLFNHAFFKALLFLTAGYIIHMLNNEQDMRRMGGLIKLLPFAYLMMFISSLSLAGFPFYSGFYSKEKILELFSYLSVHTTYTMEIYNLINFINLVSHLAIIFTIFYSVRLLYITFMSSYNGFSRSILSYKIKKSYFLNIHYGSNYVLVPLFFLFLLTISSGYLFKDLMIGVGTDFWQSSLVLKSSNELFNLYAFEFNHYERNITLFWCFYYLILFYIYFIFHRKFFYDLKFMNVWTYVIFYTLTEKYIYFNKFIEMLTNFMVIFAYEVPYLLLDKGYLEWFGPFGLATVAKTGMMTYNKLSYHYIFLVLYSILLTILILTHAIL